MTASCHILSSLLFTDYSETLFKMLLEKLDKAILLSGKTFKKGKPESIFFYSELELIFTLLELNWRLIFTSF
jgi:hypothetical protein